MTSVSSIFRPNILALALAVIPVAGAAGPDAAALISRLARPAPASIAFAEVRFSPLLREPLIVSGELGYAGPASLDRRVSEPYRENTTIRGQSVRVEREGESPRSFALKRSPELRSLLAGFTSLLAGDVVAVRHDFEIELAGAEENWSLTLTPLDPRTQRRLKRLIVNGRRDEPRCFSMLSTDGGASVMLLGAAADGKLPPEVTPDELAQRCGGGPAAWGAGRGPEKDRNSASSSPRPKPHAPRPPA